MIQFSSDSETASALDGSLQILVRALAKISTSIDKFISASLVVSSTSLFDAS